MFDNYPTPEQLFYFRQLLSQNNELTEAEQETLALLNLTEKQINVKMVLMQTLIDEQWSEDLQTKLKSELHPFVREGVLYMGSGHFAEYGCEKLHEELARALSIVYELQQGGLQGLEPDNKALVLECKQEIKGFLLKLAEKLGVTGMKFED